MHATLRRLLLLTLLPALAACVAPDDADCHFHLGPSLVLDDPGPGDRVVFNLDRAGLQESPLMVLQIPADWRERPVRTAPDGVLVLDPLIEPRLVVDPAVTPATFFGREKTGIAVDGPVPSSLPHNMFREAFAAGAEGAPEEYKPFAAIALREGTLEYGWDDRTEDGLEHIRLYVLDLERERWVQLAAFTFERRPPTILEEMDCSSSATLQLYGPPTMYAGFFALLLL